MKSTFYKFDHKRGLLDEKIFITRDYFQYYTTGVDKIVPKYSDSFEMTTRRSNESPDYLMYDVFGNENHGDMFAALNNQNYLWEAPLDPDSFQDAIDFRMNYIELLMRHRIERIIETDNNGVPFTDIEGKNLYSYNTVGQICETKVKVDVENQDEIAKKVIIPSASQIQFVDRKIKDYFKSRTAF